MAKKPKALFLFVHLSFLLFFSSAYAGSGEVPQIKGGEIIFVNGKTLRYQPHKILFSDPEEAVRNAKPVSISEEPKLIRRWNRLVLVRTLNYYEGSQKEILVYDYDGNSLGSPQQIEGEVFFLEASNRVFLGGQSAHYFVNKSLLLDQNGNLVREISQPKNVFDFGFSQDGAIIWIFSAYIKDGIPVGQAKIFGSDGDEIKNVDFHKAGEIEVVYRGKTYRISTPQPDFPG